MCLHFRCFHALKGAPCNKDTLWPHSYCFGHQIVYEAPFWHHCFSVWTILLVFRGLWWVKIVKNGVLCCTVCAKVQLAHPCRDVWHKISHFINIRLLHSVPCENFLRVSIIVQENITLFLLLPYILKSNPHPNLIRTQFLAIS